MFTPFLVKVALIFLQKRDNWKEGLREAFLHFPLVIPMKNSYHTYQLYTVKYSDPMSISSLTNIENLKMVAGKLTLIEAFLVRNNHILVV